MGCGNANTCTYISDTGPSLRDVAETLKTLVKNKGKPEVKFHKSINDALESLDGPMGVQNWQTTKPHCINILSENLIFRSESQSNPETARSLRKKLVEKLLSCHKLCNPLLVKALGKI